MKENSRNRGFSLIELIVLISMITVLTGMLVPQFVKYATEKRQTACRANREALLNIYEKAVYDGQLSLSGTDLGIIVDPTSGSLSSEYVTQSSDYLECPTAGSGGHYHAYVVNNTAYLICDCHEDDVCSVELTGWDYSLAADETAEMNGEPTYTVPAGDAPEEPAGPGDAPEEPADVNTGETCNTGVWPRPMDSQGRVDTRWASAGGAKSGNYVDIAAPLHFIDESGAEIVIVRGNNGTNAYRVSYENALSPLGKGTGALEYVVAASGKTYNDTTNLPDVYRQKGKEKTRHVAAYTETKTHTVREYNEPKNALARAKWVAVYKKNKNGKETKDVDHYVEYIEHEAEDVPTGEYEDDVITYRVNYGDILETAHGTYIYSKSYGEDAYVSLPKETDTVAGTDYDGWYIVPALTTK